MATRRNNRKPRPTHHRSFSKPSRVWTTQEVSFLRKFYRNHTTKWCAKQLGRTVYSVRYKASDMKIRKANPSTWQNPTTPTTKNRWTRPTTTRRTTRNRRNVRWAMTRKNNRATRW
jgi:hypothetical protein